jgi:hypothetical protein
MIYVVVAARIALVVAALLLLIRGVADYAFAIWLPLYVFFETIGVAFVLLRDDDADEQVDQFRSRCSAALHFTQLPIIIVGNIIAFAAINEAAPFVVAADFVVAVQLWTALR